MKTFQQIYDFCINDDTYQTYYNIPNLLECTDKVHTYYSKIFNLEKLGYISRIDMTEFQSLNQLFRFLKKQQKRFCFYLDLYTYSKVEFPNITTYTISVISDIGQKGVNIVFTNPYSIRGVDNIDNIYNFVSRSHLIYNIEGIIEEIKKFINKNSLFPLPFIDYQVDYRISHDEFIKYYNLINKYEVKQL